MRRRRRRRGTRDFFWCFLAEAGGCATFTQIFIEQSASIPGNLKLWSKYTHRGEYTLHAPHHKIFLATCENFSANRDSCDRDTCLQHLPRPHSNPSPPADTYPLNPSPRLFPQSTDTVPSESESRALHTINRYCSLRIRVPGSSYNQPILFPSNPSPSAHHARANRRRPRIRGFCGIQSCNAGLGCGWSPQIHFSLPKIRCHTQRCHLCSSRLSLPHQCNIQQDTRLCQSCQSQR